MKVKGFLVLEFSSGYYFEVECESFYETRKTFAGTPIYKLKNVDFSTLKCECGGLDGTLIEVEEIKE